MRDYKQEREDWILSCQEDGWGNLPTLVEALDKVAGRREDGTYNDVTPYLFCDICERPIINRAFIYRVDADESSFESKIDPGFCQFCSGELKESEE